MTPSINPPQAPAVPLEPDRFLTRERLQQARELIEGLYPVIVRAIEEEEDRTKTMPEHHPYLLRPTLRQLKNNYIEWTLSVTRSVPAAALILDIDVATLYRWRKRKGRRKKAHPPESTATSPLVAATTSP